MHVQVHTKKSSCSCDLQRTISMSRCSVGFELRRREVERWKGWWLMDEGDVARSTYGFGLSPDAPGVKRVVLNICQVRHDETRASLFSCTRGCILHVVPQKDFFKNKGCPLVGSRKLERVLSSLVGYIFPEHSNMPPVPTNQWVESTICASISIDNIARHE